MNTRLKNKIGISIILVAILCIGLPTLTLASTETPKSPLSTNLTTQAVNPDFGIYSSQPYLCLIAGSSGTVALRIYPEARFNGTVVLAATYPAGWTANLAPASVQVKYNESAKSTLSVAVPSNAAPGKYNITITGTSGALTHSTNVTVLIITPDFDIYACPSYEYVLAGSSVNSMIRLYSEGRFNGTIALTATFPAGWTANLAPSSVQIKYNASASSTLTTAVPSNAASGKYTVNITGTSGSLTHEISVTILVISPDFDIYACPTWQSALAGSTISSVIRLNPDARFNGTISLTATNTAGWTTTLNPTSVQIKYNESATSTLNTIIPSNAAPGKYTITVTGTSGALTHKANVTIQVITPDFDIYACPQYQYAFAGSTATSTIRLTPDGRYNGTVALVTTQPTGWTTNVAPTPVQVKYNASATSTITASIPANAAPGRYIITVTGTSGSLTHTANITIQVISPDFNIYSCPSTISLTAGSSGGATIRVIPLDKFNGTVALTLSAPAGWTSTTLAKTSLTLKTYGTNSTLLSIEVPSTTTAATYSITVTGTSGTLTHSTTLKVTVK